MGIPGRVYTNDISTICLAHEVLQKVYGLSSSEVSEKEKEIIKICKEACLLIEQAYGNYGDLGIDVVIDQKLKVWVLEINKLHQHTLAEYLAKDLDMYNRVVTKPLEYAKALAGFSGEINLQYERQSLN